MKKSLISLTALAAVALSTSAAHAVAAPTYDLSAKSDNKSVKPVAAESQASSAMLARETKPSAAAIPTPWVKTDKPQAASENSTVKARLAQRAAAAHKPTKSAKATERATA